MPDATDKFISSDEDGVENGRKRIAGGSCRRPQTPPGPALPLCRWGNEGPERGFWLPKVTANVTETGEHLGL